MGQMPPSVPCVGFVSHRFAVGYNYMFPFAASIMKEKVRDNAIRELICAFAASSVLFQSTQISAEQGVTQTVAAPTFCFL